MAHLGHQGERPQAGGLAELPWAAVQQVLQVAIPVAVPHPPGIPAGGRLGRQTGEAVALERADGVPHGLGGTPDHPPDLGRAHAAGAGQEDLGPADGERIGRLPARLQGLPLLCREGADERPWLVHPGRIWPPPNSQTVSLDSALAGAVGKLPVLVSAPSPRASQDVPTRCIQPPSLAQDCMSERVDTLRDEVKETLKMQQPDAHSHRVALDFEMSRVGIEPTTRRLKVCCSTS